ncbi:GGDEF domain-containing protein [Desulfarculus baarsii]
MVDTGAKSAEAAKLRQRVRDLTDELDSIEAKHAEAMAALREAVPVLCGLAPKEQSPLVAKALEALRRAADKNADDANLRQALEALKSAIVAEPRDYGPGASAKAKESAQSEAARHVSLALLHGLRLGDEAFDARLDKAIDAIGGHVAAGAVRPAMAILVDLLDEFRLAHGKRLEAAERALKEVVGEVLTTEAELMATFSRAADDLASGGAAHANNLTAALAGLLEDINHAPDLETMKTRAIGHIRAMREQIKNRREQELTQQAQVLSEMSRVRAALDETKAHVSAVEHISQRLAHEALTDPLTKVWNKRALAQRLAEALEKHDPLVVCLIVFDIDFFKSINDNFGHRAGDKALESIAAHAARTLRRDDDLFRYAGDEFVILMTNIDLKTAHAVAERVRAAAEKIRFTYAGKGEIRLTLSLGLANGRQGDSAASLFERADQALLDAKRQGRNRVVVAGNSVG